MAYKLLPDQQESTLYNLGKSALSGVGQAGARIAETALGTPGNILSTIGSVVSKGTGAPTYEELRKDAPYLTPPTSSDIREFGKELTGGALEPESEPAKFFNSIVETATSLATPMGALGKGQKVSTALKAAGMGETFGYLAKQLGGSDLTQGVARLIGTLGGSIAFEGKDLKKLSKSYYNDLEKELPGKMIPAKKLRTDINKLRDKYLSGDSPAKKFAQERLNALEETILKDEIDAGKLWSLKKDANQHFDTASKAERRALHDIIEAEKSALEAAPNYAKLEAADDIHRAFVDSSSAKKFIERNAPAVVPWLKPALFGGAALTSKIPAATAGIAAYKVLDEGRKITKFLNTSTGKKYYADVLKAGFEGNARAVSHSVARLNQEAKKFDKESPEKGYTLL